MRYSWMGIAVCVAVLLTSGPRLTAQTLDPAPASLDVSSESASSTAAISNGSAPHPEGPDKGFFGRVLLGNGHDSLLGFSDDIELSVGYDVSHTLAFEAGVPIFWLMQFDNTSTGAVTRSNRYGALGDVMMKMEFAPDIDAFDYTASVTGTLPSGATLVSANRGTWDVNNRIEKEVKVPFNPFVEIIFGNVLPVSTRLAQDAVITGMEFQARVGNYFQIRKSTAFQAGFYEGVPLRGTGVATTNIPMLPPLQVSDHGFIGSFLYSHSRWDAEIEYTRSIPNHLDAVWTTVSYRFGHVRKEKESEGD